MVFFIMRGEEEGSQREKVTEGVHLKDFKSKKSAKIRTDPTTVERPQGATSFKCIYS